MSENKGKCKWSYGPSCPIVFSIKYFYSFIQVTNYKLQGSVAAYLRCGGIANNQFKKGLFLILPVNFLLKIGEYMAKLQARRLLSRALCAPGHHTAGPKLFW